jgi:multidrug efflux pump subunit AcrA (membrane-fusion protein)
LRLYWADVYAARVKNKGTKEDVELAWRNYVDSSAQWNANLMVNIVGLERFYSAQKSLYFETEIQIAMAQLDAALSAVRRRQSVETETEAGQLAGQISTLTSEIRTKLYGFVRCFGPPNSAGERARTNC